LSKLLKLKEWLTVADAARRLSKSLEEEVSEADVLRLALDGRLQLSVFFTQPSPALLGTMITVEDASDHLPGDGVIPFSIESMDPSEEAYWQSYYSWASNNNSVLVDKASKLVLQVKSHDEICGLWDLTMYGEERSYAENKYRDLVDTPQNSNEEPQVGGIAVVKEPDEKTDEAYGLLPTPLRHPVSCLPTTSLLVVRTTELEKLMKHLSSLDPQPLPEKTASAAENTDLRKRIEAVLDYARNRLPNNLSKTKMAKQIMEQRKNHGYSESALKQILGGRYHPMKQFDLNGLD
jgi:hypothetical protein